MILQPHSWQRIGSLGFTSFSLWHSVCVEWAACVVWLQFPLPFNDDWVSIAGYWITIDFFLATDFWLLFSFPPSTSKSCVWHPWAVCVGVGVHTRYMSWVAWIGWGGALGLGVAAPDAASWCARIHFQGLLDKRGGAGLEVTAHAYKYTCGCLGQISQYPQLLTTPCSYSSTPAVLIGGNCRSPWHLHGDSDVNRLEYSQIQFQKLSSFEEAKCLAGRGEFLCL